MIENEFYSIGYVTNKTLSALTKRIFPICDN